MPEWGQAIDRCIDSLAEQMRCIRRHLHMNPEPSGEEYQTTLYLAQRLKEAGINARPLPSGRGLIADAATDSALPRVAMRADMDALHIHDQKAVEYHSRRDGLMHACGHDAHSTMVLAAAIALNEAQVSLPWTCPWRAIFQPAEETAQGALEMIAAGALEGVRNIIALHVDPDRLAGRIGLRQGELTACCQDLKVMIHGRGGHAARPHESVDPIAAAVHFISDVYQFLPRSVDSRDPIVVTFGVIKGGENNNVIPEQVLLEGTIRTLTRKARADAAERLERIRKGVAEITGAHLEIEVVTSPTGVCNDPNVTEQMWEAAAQVIGRDRVDYIPQPSMGGEDFAYYLDHVPGCLMRLGVARADRPRHFLHSPNFDIDETALTIGAKILARTLVLLARPNVAGTRSVP